jgi:hypothetical protein
MSRVELDVGFESSNEHYEIYPASLSPVRTHITQNPSLPSHAMSTSTPIPRARAARDGYDKRLCSEDEITELKSSNGSGINAPSLVNGQGIKASLHGKGLRRQLSVEDRWHRLEAETMPPSKHDREELRLRRSLKAHIEHLRSPDGASDYEEHPSPSTSCNSTPCGSPRIRTTTPNVTSKTWGEAAASSAPRTWLQAARGTQTMIDSGCGPFNVAHSSTAAGKTQPSTTAIIGVAGIKLLGNKIGKMQIHTVDAFGRNVTILIP